MQLNVDGRERGMGNMIVPLTSRAIPNTFGSRAFADATRMKNKLLVAAVVSATIAIVASLLVGVRVWPNLALAATVLRWLAIALISAYATSRRSLTAWILVGLLAGAELGHDAPALAAINLSRAGESVHLPPSSTATAQTLNVSPHSAAQIITDIFPENIAKPVAENQVLQIVVFSILFAFALGLVSEAKRRPMLAFAESLSEVMFKFTNIVMYAAPIGVFGAVADTVGQMGLTVFLPLLKLLATMYVALVLFILCVLVPILLLARIPLKSFVRVAAEPVTLGFATASSEATLPIAMEKLEAFGVPRQIVAFVLPTGYSFNMDGASLYQSLGLIFVAQAAGIHLSFGQQAIMVLTLLLSSKGTAGVARASFLIVFAAATSFHLPMEPLFLLFAIDQLMDMGRTAVTVLGNCVACVVIARWEGELPSPGHAAEEVQA